MKNLIYKVFSNEFPKLKLKFSTKRDAVRFAKWQIKCGWTGTVIDMRTGEIVLGGAK